MADQELKALLNADELAAFNRCVDCFDDGEGYDVPKPMMSRLAQIGVLRHVGKGVYETTEFGMHIRLADIAEPVSVPTVQAPIGSVFTIDPVNMTARIQLNPLQNGLSPVDILDQLYAAPSQPSKDGVDELILSLRSKKNGKLPRGVADKLLSILNTKTPSQPVADHTEQHLAMVPSNEQIIEQCKAAGIDWLTPDEEVGKFPGSFDMASMRQMRALLTTANAGKDAIPAYTTGHCEYHKQPGGCQQHNLHCGWPTCDQKKVKP